MESRPDCDDELRDRRFPPDVVGGARRAWAITGCLPSITLAQWALESGFGRYQLHSNNPFGMKWYVGCKNAFVSRFTRECYKGKWVTVEARFQVFPTQEAAFVAHGELLMNPKGPYRHALPFMHDWEKFLRSIAHIYATDPRYAEKLVKLVKDYRLFEFDAAESA